MAGTLCITLEIFFAFTKMETLFYLNKGNKGVKTVFYKPYGNQVNLKVIPKTGMILFHDHMIDHGVPELKKGVKYVIRTDVMYKLET